MTKFSCNIMKYSMFDIKHRQGYRAVNRQELGNWYLHVGQLTYSRNVIGVMVRKRGTLRASLCAITDRTLKEIPLSVFQSSERAWGNLVVPTLTATEFQKQMTDCLVRAEGPITDSNSYTALS